MKACLCNKNRAALVYLWIRKDSQVAKADFWRLSMLYIITPIVLAVAALIGWGVACRHQHVKDANTIARRKDDDDSYSGA